MCPSTVEKVTRRRATSSTRTCTFPRTGSPSVSVVPSSTTRGVPGSAENSSGITSAQRSRNLSTSAVGVWRLPLMSAQKRLRRGGPPRQGRQAFDDVAHGRRLLARQLQGLAFERRRLERAQDGPAEVFVPDGL